MVSASVATSTSVMEARCPWCGNFLANISFSGEIHEVRMNCQYQKCKTANVAARLQPVAV